LGAQPDGKPIGSGAATLNSINADIAYAIWHYWQATGDDEWMQREGVEIILETAVLGQSRRVECQTQLL